VVGLCANKRCDRGRTRSGAVLVLVLMVFSALSLLSFGLCHRVRLDLKRARVRGDDLKAYYLALGGVYRAVAALQGFEPTEDEGEVCHFGQSWHLNTAAGAEGCFEQIDVSWLAEASLFYSVMDEEGRLNVNTSSPAGWVNLPGMQEEIIYAILDWQDGDSEAYPNGAESGYYARQRRPYKAKNGPTSIIWELALVKDVDWVKLRGEDWNGNGVLDEMGENDGPALRPMDDGDGVLDSGLLDFFTVYGEGKVNINTASAAVLFSLPDIEVATARSIVEMRTGPDGEPYTADDKFFRSFEELAEVSGVTPYQLELFEQYVQFASKHFRVVSEARVRPGGRPCRLMGTVFRDEKDVQLLLLRQDS